MATAALTPRVRTIVICDEIDTSSIETDVFTLEGVRCNLYARAFPWRATFWVYALMSNPRPGKFAGKVAIVEEASDKTIRLVKFAAEFDNSVDLLPATLEIGGCVFPRSGRYSVGIYFSVENDEVLKGEHPLFVFGDEE